MVYFILKMQSSFIFYKIEKTQPINIVYNRSSFSPLFQITGYICQFKKNDT